MSPLVVGRAFHGASRSSTQDAFLDANETLEKYTIVYFSNVSFASRNASCVDEREAP